MANYFSPGVFIEEVNTGTAPIAPVGTSTAAFIGLYTLPPATGGTGTVSPNASGWAAPLAVEVVTNITQFKSLFGDYKDFSGTYTALDAASDLGHTNLQEAVYGYFNNGGSRCYVVRIASATDLPTALAGFEAIDDISTVAAPGLSDNATVAALIAHCEKLADRVCLLDTDVATQPSALTANSITHASPFAALYYPWIQIADPRVAGNTIFVPPSGHVAGIYARVDAQRGVHKAPANEPVNGALGLKVMLSTAQQDALNPQGINCLRLLNGNFLVWGARTYGGSANNATPAGDVTYISTRRLLNFLRDSIQRGTQWTVFEPNTPALWAKVTRDVTAFLRTVWEAGGLFGDTPAEAFFVKCDEETNPPAQRDLGKLVAQVGVAVTSPAEFVVFQIGQKPDAVAQ